MVICMSKNEDKLIKLSIAVAILICVTACMCWVIVRDSHRPKLKPNEWWVSQDPNISIMYFDEKENRSHGQMIVDGDIIEILPLFDYGGKLHILNWPTIESDFTQDADHLLCGSCTFHKNWFVMEVDLDRDGLFEGIDTITFRKAYINND